MANGLMYPTGVSAAPIDVSSGAKAFMQSAIESRINEIKSSKAEISKNQENILKAMSVRALPELARAQRDRYQGEIEKYRQGVIDKFKESGGKLTLQQQKEIQDGFVDLNERMASEVNELKQFDSFKKIALDPNFQYAYDPNKYEQIMGETYNNLMQGKGIGDLTAKVAGAMKAPSTGDYLSNRYGQDIKSLDLESLGDFDGNIFTQTELSGLSVKGQESLAKAQRLRDTMLRDPYFRNKPNAKQEVEDFISQMRSETKPYRQTTGSSGGRNKNAVDFTPSKTTIEGRDYNIVDVPRSVSQVPIIKTITSGTNITTGKPLSGAVEAELVGVDWDKKVGIFRGKGGKATKGGEVAYIRQGTTPKGKSGDWTGAYTEKDLDRADLSSQLALEYKGGRKVEEVKVDKPVKNSDGSITVSGTVKFDKPKWFTGSGEEKVSLTFEPFDDPASAATYEAPIKKTDVANWYGKATINGKDPDYYFSGEDKVSAKETKSLTAAQEAQLKIAMKNNPDWTREELIEELFK